MAETLETPPVDAALDAFRAEARAWLEENCPAEMRDGSQAAEDICWGGRKWTFQSDAQRLWLERAAAKGWTGPTWPKAYGGGGLSADEARVLKEEMRAIGARVPLVSFGISMLGPALLHYGSDEQKARFIPPIVRGEIRWCQGYSEPNAGSDLASLKTKAVLDGEDYLITGQKVWTSYADKADAIFALVRTDFDAPKHKGITFILVDMGQPGVTTRPIKLISGSSPFCETFFDEARAPAADIIGGLNNGWSVAKYLLTHERTMIGSGGDGLFSMRPLGATLAHEAEAHGEDFSASMLRTDVARADIHALAFASTMERYQDEAKAGGDVTMAPSLMKYAGTELNKRRQEILMSAGGHDALQWRGEEADDDALARHWLRSKANSIEGGTSEVQLNILAKHALQMPGA